MVGVQNQYRPNNGEKIPNSIPACRTPFLRVPRGRFPFLRVHSCVSQIGSGNYECIRSRAHTGKSINKSRFLRFSGGPGCTSCTLAVLHRLKPLIVYLKRLSSFVWHLDMNIATRRPGFVDRFSCMSSGSDTFALVGTQVYKLVFSPLN